MSAKCTGHDCDETLTWGEHSPSCDLYRKAPDQAKAAVVVECWVLVPQESLRQMMHYTECYDIHFPTSGAGWVVPEYFAMLAAPPTSPDSSRLGEGLTDAEREALDDVSSHRTSWRRGLELARIAVAQKNDEDEDRDANDSYWQHELRAFDRTFAALEPLAKRLPASPGVAGDGLTPPSIAGASGEAEFDLMQDGLAVAGAHGPRAEAAREVLHYAGQYEQDGEVSFEEVTRQPISRAALEAAALAAGGKEGEA